MNSNILIKKYTALGWLVALLIACGVGQAVAFANEDDATTVQVKLFTAFMRQQKKPPAGLSEEQLRRWDELQSVSHILCWMGEEQEPLRLPFHHGRISHQAAEYKGPPQLIFFRETRRRDDGSVVPVPLAVYEIPEGRSEVLLVFTENEGAQSPPYHVLGIDYSEKSFPQNSVRFYNLSDLSLALNIDEKKAFLNAQASYTLLLSPNALKEGAYGVQVAGNLGGKWRMLWSTRQPAIDGQRKVVFLSPVGEAPRQKIRPTILN